jgi:diguanylate cyclase (GGDEF)-like protein
LRTHQLRELASREPLTGLYNRRHFNETLERCLSEALRYDGDLSCVMIDLDHFKSVNDKFGHHAGDEILVLAANTITNQLRSADVAARFGGDEFILLLPQTDADHATVLTERICEQFRRLLAERIPRVETEMSVGIASVRGGQVTDSDALVRLADHALYQAKADRKTAPSSAAIVVHAP